MFLNPLTTGLTLQIRTIRFAGHPQETSENSVDIAHLSYIHGYHNVTHETPVLIDGPRLESRFGFSTTRKIAKLAKLTMDVSAIAHVVGLGYSFVEFPGALDWHRCPAVGVGNALSTATLIDLSIVSRMRTLHKPERPIAGLSFLPTRMRAPIVNKFIADLQIRDVPTGTSSSGSRKHYVPRPRLVRTDGEIGKVPGGTAHSSTPASVSASRPASELLDRSAMSVADLMGFRGGGPVG